MSDFPPLVCSPAAMGLIGIARRDVTPPVGVYNRSWGAAAHDTAEGVHRPLTATAVAMRAVRAGDRKTGEASVLPAADTAVTAADADLILVAVDAGWWQSADDEWFVRRPVLERFGLHPVQVMIVFAHTHAGPSICRADAAMPGGELIPGYLTRFRDAILEAVDEAIRTARPATLTWTYGKCNLGANRDLPDPAGNRVICGFNPTQPADDTLLVGRITDDVTGRITGTVVNYACHATTLAWDNRLISPDYVGAMRETVEQHTAGAPCVFLQGASGELAPREQYVGDTAVADRHGRHLGYAVLAVLESMLPPRTALQWSGVKESGAPLATWRRVPHEPPGMMEARLIHVELPLKPLPSQEEIERQIAACADRVLAERLRRKLRVRQSVGTGTTCDVPAWIWRVGDAFLVGQPNEAYSAFQVALRQTFGGRAVAVMNLVNGGVGYLSPPQLHELDIYQVWQSPFDRMSLDKLIKACEQSMIAMDAGSRGVA